ncbi:MAG: ATP-binding protein, partial [Flavobacteriaceae bacterium]|nr:ATP-binding protein [Flavobacteriaceae bacterium]
MFDNPMEWNDEIDKDKILDYAFKNMHVTKANKAMLDQYLASENQFIGITPHDFFEHDLDKGKQVFRDLFDKGNLHIDTFEKKFDGTDMIIEGDYVCMFDSQNQITGIFGIQRDITAVRQAEKDLIIAKEKAEESERLKSAFLANMSHEIRTPMNSILGFSDLLMKNNLSEEKKEKYHEIVNSSGKRLMNLISDIIDVSKIDAHQLSMHYTTFNLNNLIDNLHHQFNISPRRKNTLINTIKSLPDQHSFIHSDENRLAQVLSNLLENALKFTKDGAVVFGYKQEGNLLHFHVKDSGIGISKKDHQLIFERFGQSDNELLTVKAGSGLGLSISKGIVEILGGTIWIESELNKGATFHFTIPNCLAAKQPEITEDKDNSKEIETDSTITILIAEDEISNYYYLEAILEKYQYNLIHVENGQEAINMAKLNHINLILMDFNMPIMNGIDATVEIRKTNTSIPIIALTAYAMSEDRDRALMAGCNDYLSKPISKDMILETINKYIKKDI